MMNSRHLHALRNEPELLKKLSMFLAIHGVRNTELENLHAGNFPSSKTGDYSDVKVVSPYGEIPWNNLSRLDDEEMKKLMIDVVNHIHWVLEFVLCDYRIQRFIDLLRTSDEIKTRPLCDWFAIQYLREWDKPVSMKPEFGEIFEDMRTEVTC